MIDERHSNLLQWLTGWVILPIFVLLGVIFLALVSGFSILLGIVGLVFISVGGTIYATEKIHTWQNKDKIKLRNTSADSIVPALMNGDKTDPFFVYLRSFKLEGAPARWYSPAIYASDNMQSTTIDDELTFAIEKAGSVLLCLGERGVSTVGAARIETTDESWKQLAELLMRNAVGIISRPCKTATRRMNTHFPA